MPQRVLFELLLRGLVGDIRQQLRQKVLLEGLRQSLINILRDHEKGPSIHRIDPIIHGRPQTQFFARNIGFGTLGQVSVIDPDMAINVVKPGVLRRRHPIPRQGGAPLGRALWIRSQEGDFFPQRFNFRQPVQPQDFSPFPG